MRGRRSRGGPFTRATKPITDESSDECIAGIYWRRYASTLIRRKHDWMIIHMLSTKGNAGGVWALAAMTAPHTEGPYTTPRLLIYPQSDRFHPPLAEFFPQYVYDDTIYAPATSVAKNRSFQVLYTAPLESAHDPEAWRLEELGSLWHDAPVPHERMGIWGQTYAGVVDTTSGRLRVMHFSRNAADQGTVSIASRRLDQSLHENGFIVSAPNGPAHAILRRHYTGFNLDMIASASGPWAICWGCRGPLGPSYPNADSEPHALTRTDRMELRINGSTWELLTIDATGVVSSLGHGECDENPSSIHLGMQQPERSSITIDGQMVWLKHLPLTDGRIEIVAEHGTILKVDHCRITGEESTAVETWLASDAIAGAGEVWGQWREAKDENFRYGTGYTSILPGARAKFNIIGSAVALYAPKGPEYGRCEVCIDGEVMAEMNLHAPNAQHSAVVFRKELEAGRHSVAIVALEGVVPCDCFEVVP